MGFFRDLKEFADVMVEAREQGRGTLVRRYHGSSRSLARDIQKDARRLAKQGYRLHSQEFVGGTLNPKNREMLVTYLRMP